MTTYYQEVYTGQADVDGHTVVDDGGGDGPGQLYTEQNIIDMAADHGDLIEAGDGYAEATSDVYGTANLRTIWYQGVRPVTVPTLDEAVARLVEAARDGWDLELYEQSIADGNPYDVPADGGRVFAAVEDPSDPALISVDIPCNDNDGTVNIELGTAKGVLYAVWIDFIEGPTVVAATGSGQDDPTFDIDVPFDEDGDPDTDAVEDMLRDLGFAVVPRSWDTYAGGVAAWAIRFS